MEARPTRPRPGMYTPAICASKYESSSWRPRKYQGAFEGLGVKLKLASACSGDCLKIENTIRNAEHSRMATNSIWSRWGQTLTLSPGSAFTCWIEPALTTVRRRWVRAGAACGRAATAAAARPPPAAAGAAAGAEAAAAGALAAGVVSVDS